RATLSGLRLFQPFSARRTFWVAVSCVKGGSGARCMDSFAVFMILLRAAIGQLLDSSLPELLHKGCRQANDFARLLIQREMSRVENMHLGSGHVLAIRLGTGNDKRGIVTSPEDQQGGLMVAKPFLPNRISLQVVLIIKEQICLNIRLSWLIQKVKLIRPGVGIDSLRMWRGPDVPVAR